MMLSSGLLSLALASLAAASKKCKCLPGDPCFPTQREWDAFAQTLSRPIISNQRPLASVCYNTSSNYDPSACAEVTANQFSDPFRIEAPNALQWINYESLITNTTVEQCPFDPAPGSICKQGRVPSYVVNVSTVADIQRTFRFVTKNNLHLVVRNTGHETMGRSFGVGSVELLTHYLKQTNFSDNFVPTGAPRYTAGQHAVTIQPGVQWGELYRLADEHNRTVPGGFSAGGTVGAAGGWPLGGGHSVLSPFYGLGVDNVLQVTVVLPNTSHVTANAYSHKDLFWALRGGGGPSFGVVTSLTYKTHPNLPYTVAFYTAAANSSASYHRLLETWFKHHNGIADAGWGGAWPAIQNTLSLTFFAQGAPPLNNLALPSMEAFYSESRAIPGVDVTVAITVPYRSYFQWYQENLVDSSKGFGFNYTALPTAGIRISGTSWLLPREVTAPSNAAALADIYVNIPVSVPFLVGGGAVAKVDPDETAVTPAWRNAVSDMVISSFWNETSDAAEIQRIKQNIHDQLQPLRDLAPIPAGGQYYNEPDPLMPNWQEAFWGRHYPRLLSIKKAIDPHDLLIVSRGVNSEKWDDEVVCKTA